MNWCNSLILDKGKFNQLIFCRFSLKLKFIYFLIIKKSFVFFFSKMVNKIKYSHLLSKVAPYCFNPLNVPVSQKPKFSSTRLFGRNYMLKQGSTLLKQMKTKLLFYPHTCFIHLDSNILDIHV